MPKNYILRSITYAKYVLTLKIEMKRLIYILLILLATACDEEDINIPNTCGVSNPKEELAWLKQKIKEEQDFSPSFFTVFQGTYNGKTAFIFSACCPACNVAPAVFDCTGNQLEYSSIEFDKIIDQKLIAKGKDVTCTFD